MPALQRWWPEPREGVSAVRVILRDRVPDDGRVYVAAAAGDSPYAAGTTLVPGAVLPTPTPAWTHPHLPAEPQWLLDVDVPVVAETPDALVIDKPHGLPSTPNGRLLRATVQSLLRVRRNEPDLVAVHRLDRWTGGLLVLSRRPETRGFLQTQFQRREVGKVYRAIAPDLSWLSVGREQLVKLRMLKVKDDPQVRIVRSASAPRSVMTTTLIEKLRRVRAAGGRQMLAGEQWEYRLQPRTGHTHQLRALMNHLGAPIMADDTYPVYRPLSLEERPEVPLRLRAVALRIRLDAAKDQVHHLDISGSPWTEV